MTTAEFDQSLALPEPPPGLSAPVAALWWDTKGDWTRAHDLVNELETAEGMAVHAYLHRKEGALSNADYWYGRAGKTYHRSSLDEERRALIEALLRHIPSAR